jgi:DNA-binding CsgD family transcriptional regulator
MIDLFGSLTEREAQVVRLVCAAKPNKAIAATLGIGTETVKRHLNHAFQKIGCKTRMELLVLATKNRFVKI